MDWTSSAPLSDTHLQFIRDTDWEATPLGSPSRWPDSLLQMVDFALIDPQLAAIMWGEELTVIYNRHFVEFAGDKHPRLMGGTPSVEYAEVWDMFIDIIERGRKEHQATRHENVNLFLNRKGYLEECYVSYVFVPILGQASNRNVSNHTILDPTKLNQSTNSRPREVLGFYHTAIETTETIRSQRRTHTLLRLGDAFALSRSLLEFWNNLLRTLEEPEQEDIGWAIAYSINHEPRTKSEVSSESDFSFDKTATSSSSCSFIGTASATDKLLPPVTIDLQSTDERIVSIVKTCLRSGKTKELSSSDLPPWLRDFVNSQGAATEGSEQVQGPETLLIVPIRQVADDDGSFRSMGHSLGFLLVALSPGVPYNIQTEKFLRLLSRQVGTSAASILLIESEVEQQQELEHELTSTTRRYTEFLQMSNIAMWQSSLEGHLSYVNDAWHSQTGLTKADIARVDLEFFLTLVAEDSQEVFRHHWSLVADSHQRVTFECRMKARINMNGQIMDRWLLITCSPELSRDGTEVIGIWGHNVDVSYQKWAQQLINSRLEESLEAKAQTLRFIDTVSHEIRNPLSAILQSVDSITTEISGGNMADIDLDAIHEALQVIEVCTTFQRIIIDDILNLSKLDANLLQINVEAADPIAVLEQNIYLHRPQFDAANIQIEKIIDESLRQLSIGNLLIDKNRILQILINLSTNAIKFTRQQPVRKITFRLSASENINIPAEDGIFKWMDPKIRASDQSQPTSPQKAEIILQFEVKDTGVGMNAEEMQNLFSRFGQASPKTQSVYGGSGLGLYICKGLVELQGGRIGLASQVGEGTTFKFFIKANRAQSADSDGVRSSANEWQNNAHTEAMDSNLAITLRIASGLDSLGVGESPSTRRKFSGTQPSTMQPLFVLLVEDNLINQKVLANQLRKTGNCTVYVANHGIEALEFLKTTEYHTSGKVPLSIVLMDVEMPFMDGLSCATEIRRLQQTGDFIKHVPIIAVTANARQEQLKKALDSGMDDCITKPFKVSNLIPQIRRLIGRLSLSPP